VQIKADGSLRAVDIENIHPSEDSRARNSMTPA